VADRLSPILVMVVPTLVLIGILAMIPWIGVPAVVSIFAAAALMTWLAMRSSAVDTAGTQAAIARMNAVGAWDGAVRATMIDETGTRGFLAHHPERIGFFPISSADDLVIARSAISLIEGIPDDEGGQHRLLIVWLEERIQTRTFHAGPDLSPWTGVPTEPSAPLPRATAKIRDEE